MAQSGTKTATPPQSGKFVGRMTLNPEHGPVGSQVTVAGTGFPAEVSLDLVWESYDGKWNIEQRDGVDWNQFRGIQLSERRQTLCQAPTDENGTFSVTVDVPEDYGGMHDVYLVNGSEKLNKAGFRIDLSAQIHPRQGPIGTPISIKVQGLNPAHPIEGWYQLYYDNKLTGFVTALTTRGTAQLEIVATGDIGTHLIALEDASFGVPYLGLECSPYSYLKTFQLPFELLPGEVVLPPRIQEQLQVEVLGDEPQTDESCIWTDYSEVPSGSAFTVFGKNFSAEKNLEIRWFDIVGDRVSEVQSGRFGTGFQEMPFPLGTARTDGEGKFTLRVVPESVQGGAHALEAWCQDAMLARTYLRMSKRGYPLHPKTGPLGTSIAVEVDGVSWTEHENLVAINYDNSLVGYACGNDLMGKVIAKIHATGKPGWHFIDVYPAFRTRRFSVGLDEHIMEVPYLYQKPIVSWHDHPHGFHFRYAFKLEPSTQEKEAA